MLSLDLGLSMYRLLGIGENLWVEREKRHLPPTASGATANLIIMSASIYTRRAYQ